MSHLCCYIYLLPQKQELPEVPLTLSFSAEHSSRTSVVFNEYFVELSCKVMFQRAVKETPSHRNITGYPMDSSFSSDSQIKVPSLFFRIEWCIHLF